VSAGDDTAKTEDAVAINCDSHAWNIRNRDAALAVPRLYGLHRLVEIHSAPSGHLSAEVAHATVRCGPMPRSFVASPGGRQD
jgi:hypothetical protein